MNIMVHGEKNALNISESSENNEATQLRNNMSKQFGIPTAWNSHRLCNDKNNITLQNEPPLIKLEVGMACCCCFCCYTGIDLH